MGSSIGTARVAVVVSRFPVGSETFILAQITGLLDRGCEVDVIALKAPTGEPLPREAAGYLLDGRVTHVSQPDRRGNVSATLRALGELSLRLDPAVLRAAVAAVRGDEARRLLRLAALLRRLGPHDAVLCHFGPVGELTARAARLAGVSPRLFVAFHGYDLSRADAVGQDDPYATVFEDAVLLPVTEHWAAELAARGAAPEQIVVHRMGVDLSRFDGTGRPPGAAPSDAQSAGGDGVPIAISLCRLVPKKGIEDAIRALSRVDAEGQPVRYRILGDGPLRDHLERVAADLGVVDHVEFVGWVDPLDARAALVAADVMLAPSVTGPSGDKEGLPVSIMEAMAAGLPVVSTLHSGIPELVEHGETGALVEEGDVDGLADHLARLAADPALRRAMGEAGRVRVRALHDQRVLLDELHALLLGTG